MKRNPPSTDSSLDQAILLAFDTTRNGDAGEELGANDRAELRVIRDNISRLAFASAKAPRPGLKHELLSNIRGTAERQKTPQVWKSWEGTTAAALHVVRANEGEWEPVCEGVRAKRLFADPSRDSVTMLIRMEPGSEYPSHRHGGDEECLVLEGDVEVGAIKLNAGDYQCARTSSVHDVTRTVNGCLLLIVSSMHDQLLA